MRHYKEIEFHPFAGPSGEDPKSSPELFGRAAWLLFKNGYALRLFHQPGEFGGSSGTLAISARLASYEISVHRISKNELTLSSHDDEEDLLANVCKQAGIARSTPDDKPGQRIDFYNRGIASYIGYPEIERIKLALENLPSAQPYIAQAALSKRMNMLARKMRKVNEPARLMKPGL